ncbi:hypothetical protein TNCV_87081 [Trichonephila clavipes]|nr:hypothetical protein TNCV_87081 [Trichonephila clavipes]
MVYAPWDVTCGVDLICPHTERSTDSSKGRSWGRTIVGGVSPVNQTPSPQRSRRTTGGFYSSFPPEPSPNRRVSFPVPLNVLDKEGSPPRTTCNKRVLCCINVGNAAKSALNINIDVGKKMSQLQEDSCRKPNVLPSERICEEV